MTNSSFSLITWNLHHGGGIKITQIIEALGNNPADVLVLTEFRDGENGEKIKDTLSKQGLTYQRSSAMPSATNGVLIASRYELIPLEAISHRLVPVAIPALDLTVIGLHIPGENDKWGKKEHWEQVLSFAGKHANQRTILVGDFNTGLSQDAEGTPFTRSEAMQSLLELGYQDAWRTKHGDQREYTWYSNAENGFRLDYAFLSPALSPYLLSADHRQDVRISRVSDHALLRVTFGMTFDHPEDRAYFAALLCDGDEGKLMPRFGHCFDFRDPAVKRAEFDAQKKSLMTLMLERYGRCCMLQYPKICEGSEKLLLDHFIPLSSNKLNKTLRHLSALKGKKVQTQSFGANHPDNFVLACPRCNAFKMNKIPDAELLARVTAAKSFASSSVTSRSFMPNSEETFTLTSGEKLAIRKCCTSFPIWKGAMPENTYGGKQVLDADEQPAFAELVVLWTLKKEGWRGVWVDTYGKKYRVGLPGIVEPVTLPPEQTKLIEDITARAGSFKGCWDVFLWKGNDHLFIELKRKSKDAIRETQVRWLEASLAAGISPKDFLLVEWEPIN